MPPRGLLLPRSAPTICHELFKPNAEGHGTLEGGLIQAVGGRGGFAMLAVKLFGLFYTATAAATTGWSSRTT